jgi:hypothetical protein
LHRDSRFPVQRHADNPEFKGRVKVLENGFLHLRNILQDRIAVFTLAGYSADKEAIAA